MNCQPPGFDAVVVRHANALNELGVDFFAWLRSVTNGTTIIEECDLVDCTPVAFELDTHTAGGNNGSMYRFTMRPYRIDLL